VLLLKSARNRVVARRERALEKVTFSGSKLKSSRLCDEANPGKIVMQHR
jgi:hypothetical protein